MFNFDSLVFQTVKTILSIPTESPIDVFENEQGFCSNISNYKFPVKNRNYYDYKVFLQSCKTPVEFFIQYSIDFSYSKEGIDFLININSNEISSKLSNFYKQFILYNFLSCLKQYLINNKVDDILNVMKSLLIYNTPLNLDCFFLFYSIIISKRPNNQFDQLFELIKSVFSQKNEKKSSTLYFLLFQHFASLKIEEMKQNSFPNSEKLKSFINDLLTKQPPITTEIAIELYNLIESLLLDNFDLQTLEIFVNLSPFLSDQTNEKLSNFPCKIHNDQITKALSIFPCKIIQFIEKSQNPYISLGENEKITADSFNLTLKSKNYTKALNTKDFGQVLKGSAFERSLPKDKSILFTFSENINQFEIICDKTIISILVNISKFIQGNHDLFDAFYLKFLNLIKNRVIDKFSLSILASYFIFCHINQYKNLKNDLSYCFFEYNIWSTSYSVFHCDTESHQFQIINTLRYFALNIVLNNKSSFYIFFMRAIEDPIIMTEISERLQVLHFSLLLTLFDKNNSLLMETICSAMKTFEQKKDDESWINARYSLFKLLLKLMKTREIIKIITDDEKFWTFFLDLILDFKLKIFVLKELRLFLTDCCTEVPKNFITPFSHLFHKIIKTSEYFPEKKNLLSSIMKVLYEVFDLNRPFAKTFSIIIHPFLDYLKANYQSQLFELIFQYFDYLKDEDIPENTAESINFILMRLGYDDKIFNLIKSKVIKNYIIDHPCLLNSLLSYGWIKKSNEIIDLFIDCCKYSSDNSLILFEQKVVSTLICELKDSELTDEEIKKRLNLFEHISLVSSSLNIVDKFISILKEKLNYMPILEKLFLFNEELPILYIPFSFEFQEELIFDRDVGFSFTIWLHLDNENDGTFISQFDGGYKINSYIHNCKLFVYNSEVFDIPFQKWNFLVFSIENKTVTCTLNAKNKKVIPIVRSKIESIINSTTILNKNQMLKYKIGKFDNLSGKIGNFGFFPYLKDNQIEYLFKIGPRHFSSFNLSSFKYISQTKMLEYRSKYMKIKEYYNFQHFFLQNNRIDFFIECDQLYKDKEQRKRNFSLFANCLLCEISQQYHLYKKGGFKFIYNILISINEEDLTKDIYFIFYNLYNGMAYDKLKNSLVKVILTNLNLWKRSPELLDITNHWKTDLFPKLDSNELIKITDLLILMRIILHYNCVEPITKEHGPINQYYEISNIRKNIIEILINSYSDKMSVDDIAFFIHYLIDNPDVQQVQDLLLFLKHLSINPSKSLLFFVENGEICLLFHILLVSNNIDIVMSALSIIFNLRKFFKKNEIECLFDVYQFQMLNTQISDKLLDEMITLFHNGFEELFPLCCFNSILHKDGANFFSKIFQNIEAFTQKSKSLIWDIWAFYGAIIFNDKENAFSKLVLCKDIEKISHFYFIIDRICHVFNLDGNYWKSILLNNIADSIISQDQNELQYNIEYVKKFFDLTFDFIFSQNCKYDKVTETCNIEFSTEILDSKSDIVDDMVDFLNESQYFLPSLQKISKENSFDTFRKIIDSSLFEEKFLFGIRVNEKNEWLDYNLAIKILRIFENKNSKNKFKSYDHFIKILSHFSRKLADHSEFSNDHQNKCIKKIIDKFKKSYIKLSPNKHINSIRQYLNNSVIERTKHLITKKYFYKKYKIPEIVFNDPMDSKIEVDENSEPKKINDSLFPNLIEIKQNPQVKSTNTFKNIEFCIEVQKIQRFEKIGEGSQSIVYRILYEQEELALKELKTQGDEEYFTRFRRFFEECEIVNSLNHPNIIKSRGGHFFDTNDDDGRPFIIFEYIPNTLGKIVKNLTNFQRVTVIYEICLAMNEVHKSGKIHRDLKPDNIFIDNQMHVKLGDFGISCLIDINTQVSYSKTSGVGTLFFMAPEMLNKYNNYTNKVDVYSFGVVLYYILTNGEMPLLSIADIVSGKKVSFPNCINKISAYLIDWCMSNKAKERPSFDDIIKYINNQRFDLIDGVIIDIDQIKQFLSH